MLHGALHRLRIDSRLLADNPLGDPHVRELVVYTPPGYDESRRYPAVMMLAGYAATHASILSFRVFAENTVERFDRQVREGDAPPALIVLPDCMNRWGGSQFLDSEATGRYQSYLADEIWPAVDTNFRTIAAPEGRAAVGRSSGGFGAIRLAMDRPGLLGAIACHAADADFEVTMRPMLTSAATAFERAGGFTAFAERLLDGGPRDALDFDGAFVLASSAAYCPDMKLEAPHCRPPVVAGSADLDEESWRRWLEHDPLRRVERSRDALSGLRLAFLDAGNGDEHGLHFAARKLAAALEGVGVPVEHEEFEGGHRGTSYRYETSLPRIIASLERG